MTNVLQFPRERAAGGDRPSRLVSENRTRDAALLRKVVEEGSEFRGGDQSEVAARIRAIFDQHARDHGRGAKTRLCRKLWEHDDNPVRRLADVKKWKKPSTFLGLIESIAKETGKSADDMLLAVFRGTTPEAEVTRRLSGQGPEPDLEEFWTLLSKTLHTLAASIARVEGMYAHLERMVALHGTYSLASESVRASSDRFVRGPLGNEFEIFEEYPPIPSVPLFREPKSQTVRRLLIFRDTYEAIPVEVTIWREVRLAIGPVDDLLVPGPLFEFRSVLGLRAGGSDLPVRVPWLFLEREEDIEVEIEGEWRSALLILDQVPNPDAVLADIWRFPATLEAGLQWEHSYGAWRPVTPVTCRALLLWPEDSKFEPYPREDGVGACPRGTLGEALELALAAEGPDSLPKVLRAEAHRLVQMLRLWHQEQLAAGETMHRNIRARWENWT